MANITAVVRMLLAKIWAYSAHQSQKKSKETETGGNRKVAFILSEGGRGEHSRVTPQDLCPHLHEKSRGFYKAGIQESAMRTEADRILILSSCIVSKAVINWQQ